MSNPKGINQYTKGGGKSEAKAKSVTGIAKELSNKMASRTKAFSTASSQKGANRAAASANKGINRRPHNNAAEDFKRCLPSNQPKIPLGFGSKRGKIKREGSHHCFTCKSYSRGVPAGLISPMETTTYSTPLTIKWSCIATAATASSNKRLSPL